jgi:hypothetical protein
MAYCYVCKERSGLGVKRLRIWTRCPHCGATPEQSRRAKEDEDDPPGEYQPKYNPYRGSIGGMSGLGGGLGR